MQVMIVFFNVTEAGQCGKGNFESLATLLGPRMHDEISETRQLGALLPRIEFDELIGAQQQIKFRPAAHRRDEVPQRIDCVGRPAPPNLDV